MADAATPSAKLRSQTKPTWCPGCGYFGILQALTRALGELGLDPDATAVVSGIGCSGRTAFFLSAYGFHVAHGRTLPVATGVKLANPALTVLAMGGDGDGLGIGGGHLLHAARRNPGVTYLLFDNGLYGLTKGQVSPTSPAGFVSKTTPYGSAEIPLDPVSLALTAGAPFAARGFAGDQEGLAALLREAVSFPGFALVQILSPCVTFGPPEAWDRLRHAVTPLPALHDTTDRTAAIALAMARPHATGVFYRVERGSLEEEMARVRIGASSSQGAER